MAAFQWAGEPRESSDPVCFVGAVGAVPPRLANLTSIHKNTDAWMNESALLSLEARLAMNDTAAFTTVLEASFASGRVIEVCMFGVVYVCACLTIVLV